MRGPKNGVGMGRVMSFVYGIIAHMGFLLVFLYLIGFLGNFAVPKSIDSGQTEPFCEALLIDLILVGLFAIQQRDGTRRFQAVVDKNCSFPHRTQYLRAH